MSDTAILSSDVVGEPVRLSAAVRSLDEIVSALRPGTPQAGLLPLAPGAVLAHALDGGCQRLELRWAFLPPSTLAGAADPVELVVLLVAPLDEIHRVPRIAARLAGCFRDPELASRLAAESSREGLVRVLRHAEDRTRDVTLTGDEVLALVGAATNGLGETEARRRLEAQGPNRLESVRRRPLVWRFLEQFYGLFALMLWAAGVAAFFAGMPQLGWAIFAVVVINGTFSFFQEYRAERALEALERLLPAMVTVVRDGRAARVAAEALVPGDVLQIEEGDRVPADGQVIGSDDLAVDQSPMTGESHPVLKLPAIHREMAPTSAPQHHERVFAGTGVLAGRGTMVVIATGMASEIGSIARLTQAVPDEPSPLQREMTRVTRLVTLLAIALGVLFFALGVAAGTFPAGEGVVFALGIIVANVPEGLLPTLTLALALGAQRMARRRSLVRRLSAVEGLGATTVICTDKTGTLTENRMAARYVWASGRTHDLDGPPGAAADPSSAPAPAARAAGGRARASTALNEDAEAREVLATAVLGSLATVERGDSTERALVAAAERAGIATGALRDERRMIVPYPFDSFRKRMTVVRATPEGPVAFVKGAPRLLLALCTHARDGAGRAPLSAEARAAVLAEHDRLARDGFRMLAVASRPLPGFRGRPPAGDVERDLEFLGLIALWDPPRAEVRDAIAQCKGAGIRVVMITGDDGLTGQAIATRVGLATDVIVTGDEVDRLSPEALARVSERRGVLFARASPAHKLAIVRALQGRGEVVAVTGDGVNDAPALRAADVGVAMGLRGSEVAKEAAVIVITDDHFASIVAAVREGRSIYANVGKFVRYIFASNVPELAPFLVAIFFHVPLPLTVMQILAVDLGTDLLPALALGAERPEAGVMERPPRPRSERLLNGNRLAHAYGFLGVIEAVLALAGFFWVYWLSGWRPGMPMAAGGDLYTRATTMTFAGIVAGQIGNVFACRTERESVLRAGLAGNRFVLWAIVAEVALLLVLIFVPPLAAAFGLAPLSPREWTPLIAFPFVLLGLEELRKAWMRRS